ncbi:MAG: hypothetical protein WCG51_06750, partial [Elusimicrobiota bacterium]
MNKALIISDSPLFQNDHRYFDDLEVSYTSFEELDEKVIEIFRDIDIFIIDMNVRDVSRYFYGEYFKHSYGREPIIDKTFLDSKERSFIILDAPTANFKVCGVDLKQEEIP